LVVYTANFGGYDRVRSTLYPGVEHVLFTDEDVKVDGWETIVVQRKFDNPARENRYYKLQPHVFFPGETTIYHDSSMRLRVSPGYLVEWFKGRTRPDASLYALEHPLNHTIGLEFSWLSQRGIIDPELLSALRDRYASVPDDKIGIEARLLIHTGGAEEFFNAWWGEVERFAHRDQLSFHYARAITNPDIAQVPLKEAREFFNIYPHSKPQLQGAK